MHACMHANIAPLTRKKILGCRMFTRQTCTLTVTVILTLTLTLTLTAHEGGSGREVKCIPIVVVSSIGPEYHKCCSKLVLVVEPSRDF